jgi:hypothetical protein
MSKKKQKELKRSDVKTLADKIAYSRMMYERHLAAAEEGNPLSMMDLERFPIEVYEWEHPEWWIGIARTEQEKRKWLKVLKHDKDK